MRLRNMVMSIQMNKIINTIIGVGICAAAATVPVQADDSKITQGYYTMDAMGCMLLEECTTGVIEIHTMLDIAVHYPQTDFIPITIEFNRMMESLKRVGVNVYLAPEHYFPVANRGVYHTVSNNFYLNRRFMHRPHVLMRVMRHEGWHAAQDCMAGTIDNSMIAIIKPEEDVPMLWREMVERTYPKESRPWEAEASWAGRTEGMTAKALEACAAETMWSVYDPTPLTREWLVNNGYIN